MNLTMRTGARALCAALFTICLSSCGKSESPSTAEKTAAAGPQTIDVVKVIEEPLHATLTLPSELTAYQSVAIYPRVTGFVKTIKVDRGSHVKSGDVIAVLEAPELLAQRSEAQSKLQAAQAQLSAVRAKADADASTYAKLKAAAATPGVVSGNELAIAAKTVEADAGQTDAAQQNVEAVRQVLNSVTQMQDYLTVTAPFDGVVTERNVHPGALVGPGSGAGAAAPLVRVVDASRLRLVVPVPEAYTADLPTGAALSFTAAAYPNQRFSGTVARIAHAVDAPTRTMAVELDVMNKDGRLAPGTFCQVEWPLRRDKPSLLVPKASIASTTARTFVIKIRDGKAEWIDVKTGVASGTLVEIFGDLHTGDIVAARGTDELRPGTAVRAKSAS